MQNLFRASRTPGKMRWSRNLTLSPNLTGTAPWTWVLAVLVIWTVGCESSDGPTQLQGEGNSRVQILLTDHPLEASESAAVRISSLEVIEVAEVWISRVYLVGGGHGQVDLFNDPENPRHLDLLQLHGGVTAELTEEVPVPSGIYGQLRFVVDSGRVVLAGEDGEGYTFSDGSREQMVQVPSGFVRVNLKGRTFPPESSNGGEFEAEEVGELTLEDGETMVLLFDFDVEASLNFPGPPGNPHGVQLLPVLHELSREVR